MAKISEAESQLLFELARDKTAQGRKALLATVHDLFLACPNFSLLYRNVEPCGIPDDLSVCDRCLETVARSPMPGSPQTQAIEAFHAHTATGKLNAVMTPIGPNGCHCSLSRWPGRSLAIVLP